MSPRGHPALPMALPGILHPCLSAAPKAMGPPWEALLIVASSQVSKGTIHPSVRFLCLISPPPCLPFPTLLWHSPSCCRCWPLALAKCWTPLPPGCCQCCPHGRRGQQGCRQGGDGCPKGMEMGPGACETTPCPEEMPGVDG